MHTPVAVEHAAVFDDEIGLRRAVDRDALDLKFGRRALGKLGNQIVRQAGKDLDRLEAQFLFLRRRGGFIVAGRPGM